MPRLSGWTRLCPDLQAPRRAHRFLPPARGGRASCPTGRSSSCRWPDMVVDRSSHEFRGYLDLYQHAPLLELGAAGRRGALAAAPRARSSPTSSTATSTTPTSASPTASSARSIAGRSTSRATCSRSRRSARKIDEVKALGGVQILMQGGHNPYIPFEWYLDLLRYIKRNHPIHIHALLALARSISSPGASACRSTRSCGSWCARGSTRSRAAAARSWCRTCATGSPRRRPAPIAGSRSWRSRTGRDSRPASR